MKNTLRVLALWISSLLVAPAAIAAPYVADATLTAQLNSVLAGTPLAGYGEVFFQQGFFYNVDPRLVVAIAGAQTSYGASAVASGCPSPSVTNDPFGLLGCAVPGTSFPSLTAAIETATQNLKNNFTTYQGTSNTTDLIALMAPTYCAIAACPVASTQWATNVEAIYTASGAYNTDLSFPGATITFEDLSGPCCFTSYPGPTYEGVTTSSATSMTVEFDGGQVLGGTSNLPGDQSVVYGTADYCSGCAQTIDIYFSQPVSTLSFFLINGNTVTVTYDTVDYVGATVTTTLVSNFGSGVGEVTVPDSGITHVNISGGPAPGGCCVVDFFVDNFTFSF